jgi:hypothetical protein
MRRPGLLFVLMFTLTASAVLPGCSVSPQSLGITGPGPVPMPPGPQDDTVIQNPGIPPSGNGVAPVQRFYNYND